MKSIRFVLVFLAAVLSAQDSTPPAGWKATGALSEARYNSCAASLVGNMVLVAGGTGANGDLASAEIYSSDGTFAPAASMNAARSHHTCTVLADGRVLAAGGAADGSAEIYDPAADTWQSVGTGEVRSGQAAMLLADGRVLLAGGVTGGVASSTLEIFDPVANTLAKLDATLAEARQDLAAALLPDGTVLMIGGRNEGGPLASVEQFNPANGLVGTNAAMSTPRNGHAAVVLDDGRVLVAGGSDGINELTSAEIYDINSGLWTVQQSHLNVARRDFAALRIPGNGGVLIAGGQAGGTALSATEIYLPIEGTFVPLGALTLARTGMAAAAFDDGSVLAAGGLAGGVAQSACGTLLVPTVKFSNPTIHPTETSQATGSFFTGGTTVNLTLNLQGVTGALIASAQSRLITKSVTAASGAILVLGGFGPVPIFAATNADAGQTFRLTATAPNNITATALAPVKVKVTMTASPLNPQFEGTNATFLVQLISDTSLGPLTGTVAAALGGDLRSATVNTSNGSSFVSFSKTNVPVGTLAISYTYSGDTLHEAASAATTFTAFSRTPTISLLKPLGLAGAGLAVGTLLPFTAVLNGPSAPVPGPSGTVTFFDRGVALGTATLTTSANGPAATGATFSFTPLTVTSLSVTATYSGDSTYRSVTSPALPITVSRAITTLQFTNSGILLPFMEQGFVCGSPATFSALLTFPQALGVINRTVTVSGVGANGDGSVIQAGLLGQGTLTLNALPAGTASATIATIAPSLPQSVTSVTVAFAGDTLLAPSTSPPLSVSVQPVPVTVQFTSTPTGGGVTLNASVTPSLSCGPPLPSGTISYTEGSAVLAVVPLPTPAKINNITDGLSNTIMVNEGASTSVVVARPAGPHTFVAHYSGDRLHKPADSAPVTVTFQ